MIEPPILGVSDMFRNASVSTVLLLLPLLATCADESPVASPEEGPPAYEIQAVAGDHQYGRTGMFFPESPMVLVTDREGEPVKDARIEWEVVEGPVDLDRPSTLTSPYGRTMVTMVAGARLGDFVVRARARSMPEVETYFTGEVSTYQVVMKSDQYKVMTFSSDLHVTVGDTIEWLNKDMTDSGGPEHMMHSATSIRVPSGARHFDSGKLGFDQTYRWVPKVPGRYEYGCKDHPQPEMMYGTIDVRAE